MIMQALLTVTVFALLWALSCSERSVERLLRAMGSVVVSFDLDGERHSTADVRTSRRGCVYARCVEHGRVRIFPIAFADGTPLPGVTGLSVRRFDWTETRPTSLGVKDGAR